MSESDLVKSRLAATHVVSVVDKLAASRKGIDYATAITRLAELINDDDIDRWHSSGAIRKKISVVEMMVEDCVKVLQDAPLTINFEPYKFFGSKVGGDKFQSIWHRLRSKQPGYGDLRNEAETLMFGYDKEDQEVDGVKVGLEISKYGKVDLGPDGQPRSHSFVADIRPKYAAVNFTWATSGSAPLYGLSHFVLKDYLRFNAAFSPHDSFNVKSSSEIGSYFNLYPILANCADFVLKQILISARLRTPPGPPSVIPDRPIASHEIDKGGYGTPGLCYVEAMLNSDVVFSRDVKLVRVANIELLDKSTADPVTLKRFTVKGSTIKKNLKAFLSQHNLKTAVEYF